ncbi:MAG: hypothetical protein A2Z88_02010 [Omnitrophica WOR_2 bacterium GWA2_47_8]|nr:MAG: hypothetical protein A2Z88_02010 [Omnitrophica WOR_2 bacterium GWA2_47_8]
MLFYNFYFRQLTVKLLKFVSMKKLFFKLLIGSLLFFYPAFFASAQVVYDAHTKAELISENISIAPGQTFWVGLLLKHDKGWHTYWQNPGDSGIPTKITWTLPEGFSASEIYWQYPTRLHDSEGITSYGYLDEVVLLAKITPAAQISESTVTIKARADWLACEVPCVPGKAEFSLRLAVLNEPQIAVEKETQEIFNTARTKIPVEFFPYRVKAKADDDFIHLIFYPDDIPQAIRKIEFFPFYENIVTHSAEQKFESVGDGYQFTLSRNKRGSQPDIKKLEGVAVVTKDDNSVVAWQIETPIVFPKETSSPQSTAPLLVMLAFAFLGGVILNLMPCVFPVLSLKVLTFVRYAQKKTVLLRSAFGYSLGVVLSFAALAGVLIVLRESGEKIGWGFQFQSPYFVVGITFLLFIMALNLFGISSFNIPFFVPREKITQMNFNEAFLSGVLATIVATPCTAPFMGTALSFALTQTAAVNMLIFIFLGLGMAFPFVVLCLSPGLLKFLPKPGAWMEDFKKFLGFPLLATVIWLLWVLAGQKDAKAVWIVVLGLFLVSLGLWLNNIAAKRGAAGMFLRFFSWTCIVSAVILPFKYVGLAENKTIPVEENTRGMAWIPYEKGLLEQAKKDKKIIFIDFTARWCLTCQVNERFVLAQPEIIRKFKELNVVTIKADWTNRDENISKALADLGRNSVPVYVFIYPVNGKIEQDVLPEVLTPSAIIDHLNKIIK